MTESSEPLDPYARLGIPPGASAAEITAAFRREVRGLHPDSAPDDAPADAGALGEVLAAHRLLADPDRRRAFDRRSAAVTRPHPGADSGAGTRGRQCPVCAGRGAFDRPCPHCAGRGAILTGSRWLPTAHPCASCSGRGIRAMPCGACAASGTIW